MSEFEDTWELTLAEAMRRAQTEGRADIAGYLDLRAQNDLLRRAATDWFMITFTSLAAVANRHGAGIQIEQKNAHRFHRDSATMVGTQLTLRRGVRALTIESGWPRAPRDGIVRGGGLACANIKHLGIKSANEELLLIRSQSGKPCWVEIEKRGRRAEVHEATARNHIAI